MGYCFLKCHYAWKIVFGVLLLLFLLGVVWCVCMLISLYCFWFLVQSLNSTIEYTGVLWNTWLIFAQNIFSYFVPSIRSNHVSFDCHIVRGSVILLLPLISMTSRCELMRIFNADLPRGGFFTWNTPKFSRLPRQLEKIWFSGVKSWFFTRNTPNISAPPSARRNCFKCPPSHNLKSWIRPCYHMDL